MTNNLAAVLVGCGGISAAWLNALKDIEGVRVAGLVDINENAALARADEYGLNTAVTGTDLASVLSQTRPDVLFNCTIPEAHATVTLTALDHGCHVLTEKPLADTLEDAQKLVEASKRANRLLAVIQNRRYHSNIRRLHTFLESGRIGKLTTVNSDFYLGAHFGGFRDHMQHVLLLDMAIHTFDAARFIIGTDPVSVYCQEWNPRGSWYDQDASAIAIFKMNHDVIYCYRGSWCAEGLNTSWEGEWRAIATNGSVTWDGADSFEAQEVLETGGFHSKLGSVDVPPEFDPDKTGFHAGVIREFVRCVREGGVPETIASDNIKSLAMVFAAIESADTGKEVQVRW